MSLKINTILGVRIFFLFGGKNSCSVNEVNFVRIGYNNDIKIVFKSADDALTRVPRGRNAMRQLQNKFITWNTKRIMWSITRKATFCLLRSGKNRASSYSQFVPRKGEMQIKQWNRKNKDFRKTLTVLIWIQFIFTSNLSFWGPNNYHRNFIEIVPICFKNLILKTMYSI